MFWIIFGTASFTALVVIVTIVLMVMHNMGKAQNYARKRGFCPTCGAPRLTFKQMTKGKGQIGFKGNHDNE